MSKSSRLISNDKLFIKLYYWAYTGRWLDELAPETFSDKLQCLKRLNSSSIMSSLVDKYQVREIISHTIGADYLIPLIGVWDSFDEIPFDNLPQRFVLKTTHDSGGVWVCKDKTTITDDTISAAKKMLTKRLHSNYFYKGRETPYKYAIPRIVAEQYMEEENGEDLKDYKIYCFDGIPRFIHVDSGRFIDHRRDFYDTGWNHLPFTIGYPNKDAENARPRCLTEMIEIAAKLSHDFPFVRVDLYEINGKVYFGEMTFHPGGGIEPFAPVEFDTKIGELLKLPNIT